MFILTKESFKYILNDIIKDVSLWLLIFSNFITIFFAIKDGWSLAVILWIYWSQSVIIGIFSFIRLVQFKESSTGNFYAKNRTAFFFLFHYGFFHFCYALFLLNSFRWAIKYSDIKFILLSVLLFFVNHLFSYIYNKPRDTKNQKIGTLMGYPYARIIPMHFLIVSGVYFGQTPLIFFLLLKTLSDAVMHIVHRFIRKNEEY